MNNAAGPDEWVKAVGRERVLGVLARLPEPALVWFLQRRLRHPLMEVALAKHASVARHEIRLLADAFLALASQTTVPTPAIERLYAGFDPAAPPLRAGGVLAGAATLGWRTARA